MSPLQQAAQTLIDRWEHPEFTGPFLAERMLALSKALDAEIVQSVEPVYGWLTACDEEMLCTHIGVANLSDSYASAKAKLRSLIDWHVGVAIDPAVNGGFSLRKAPQQAKQVPMTNEEVLTLVPGLVDCLCDPYDKQRSGDDYSSVPVDMLRLARAIEAHHGIGGQP